MFPLKNLNPRYTFPSATVLLIVVNVLVFLFQLSLGPHGNEHLILAFGVVPAKLQWALAGTHQVTLADATIPLFTSMFLHGGFLHILGNMWFLWIFGPNVEERVGHFAFLGFYLLCGLGAGLAQAVFSWGSHIPSIGASGAISGVLGAYILFYPSSSILTLVPLFVFWFTARLPAIVFIGIWFVLQFLSGLGSLGMVATGGVAWWAHVSGFLLGMLLVMGKRPKKPNYYYA